VKQIPCGNGRRKAKVRTKAKADPSLLRPNDEDLSSGTRVAQDDRGVLGLMVPHPCRKSASRMGHPAEVAVEDVAPVVEVLDGEGMDFIWL